MGGQHRRAAAGRPSTTADRDGTDRAPLSLCAARAHRRTAELTACA